MNGVLSGLVGITSACGTVELYASCISGIGSGIIYYIGTILLIHYKLDDVVNGIPVHLLNGIWAMLITGIFSSPHATKAAYGTDKYVGLFFSVQLFEILFSYYLSF